MHFILKGAPHSCYKGFLVDQRCMFLMGSRFFHFLLVCSHLVRLVLKISSKREFVFRFCFSVTVCVSQLRAFALWLGFFLFDALYFFSSKSVYWFI